MNSDIGIQVAILIVLLLMSAFFSSAETALVGVSKMKIRSLAEDGNKRAQVVLKIFSQESKMLSAILIGNNLVNTFMASIASMIAYNFGGYAVSIATFIITFLILVFGEITPKTLATKYSEKLSLTYAPIILFLMRVLTPIIWFINLFSDLILRLFGVKGQEKGQAITESELHTIIDVSHEEGVIEAEEREMIKNVFDFTDAKAREIMVPRVHVTAIDKNATYDEIIDTYRADRFTRMPVYEETVDNVIGIINMKDLLLYDPTKPFKIEEYLRKPYFTVETKSIAELFDEMQKDQYNMTIVLDEYGELSGILTVEDIVEEIVGNVQDEYDTNENDNVRKIGDRTWLVKGYLSLNDLNDILHLDLNSEEFDSVGGLIIEKLGQLPRLHDRIVLDTGVTLTVAKVDKNRIEEVEVRVPEQALPLPEQSEEKKDQHHQHH